MQGKILKFFNKNWKQILILQIFFFTLLYSLLSLNRHNRFDSFAYDLGIYDQVIWKYSQFKAPFSTIKGKIIFGDHFTPSLILLAPLFWLWDNVRFLLFFQAFWLAASSWPIFKIAKYKKLPSFLGLIISFIYLLFYGFQQAINFDFHSVIIGVGLMPWLIYFWLKEKWLKFFLIAIVFSGFKENLCLFVAALGLISLLRKNKIGFWLVFLPLIYFLLTIKIIIPYFSPQGYEYNPVFPKNLSAGVKSLFLPQEKQQVWFYSLGWFSFLPFLAPYTLIAVVLDLLGYFLNERLKEAWGLFMHYRATLAPFLAWGSNRRNKNTKQ